MKRTVVLALALILITVLAACSSGAPTKGDVIVYVAGPLSGFQANTGQTVAGGVRLMAEQLNRSGGLLGGLTMVLAWIGDIILLPALLYCFHPYSRK